MKYEKLILKAEESKPPPEVINDTLDKIQQITEINKTWEETKKLAKLLIQEIKPEKFTFSRKSTVKMQ